MKWRAHIQEVSPHIHVRLFVAQSYDHTFAGVGQLTMRRPEWFDFSSRLDLKVTQSEIIDQEATNP